MAHDDDPLRARILDVAMELAAEGGFDNVRQRDVAAGAGIALGTLYKRFRSKEDILSALLGREAEVLERRLKRKPPQGDDEVARLCDYYAIVTRWLCRRPQLARAMLRAMTAGDEHSRDNATRYHGRMVGLVVGALQGPEPHWPTERDLHIASLLQHVWFAALVGWSSEWQTQAQVIATMNLAAESIVRGIDSR